MDTLKLVLNWTALILSSGLLIKGFFVKEKNIYYWLLNILIFAHAMYRIIE